MPQQRKNIQFRVYPESVYGFWFDCTIYRTAKHLRKAVKNRGGNPTNDGVRGIVQHFRVIRNGRYTKQLGHIHLCESDLSAEVLSHESAHAALNWADHMKINVRDQTPDKTGFGMSEDSGEERFAYALGRICSQLSHQVWEHDLVAIPE